MLKSILFAVEIIFLSGQQPLPIHRATTDAWKNIANTAS
jgi:hypothetical protein